MDNDLKQILVEIGATVEPVGRKLRSFKNGPEELKDLQKALEFSAKAVKIVRKTWIAQNK